MINTYLLSQGSFSQVEDEEYKTPEETGVRKSQRRQKKLLTLYDKMHVKNITSLTLITFPYNLASDNPGNNI